MRLRDWFKLGDIAPDSFAYSIGVNPSAMYRYINRTRVPKPAIVLKIYVATMGAVEPNDHFDLPDLNTGEE